MRDLVSGMIVMGYLVGALHFLRFWSRTHDRLFIVFAVAFALLALQRVLLTAWATSPRADLFLYSLRLAAFVFILLAIIDKNRGPGSTATG
jgi:hypothetical protein